jgi:RHS repeat-associated protein
MTLTPPATSGQTDLLLDVSGYFAPASVASVVAYHAYLPFGVEATYFAQDFERMKFTGHERDLADASSPAADLDYMHARHYNFLTGRFLSIDSHKASPKKPQGWNRYSYTLGNPLRHFDPDGNAEVDFTFRAFIPQESVGIFRGDNRSFSTAADASSRTSITVKVETDPTKRGSANPLLGPPDVKIGTSHATFSSDGKTATGPVLPNATASYDANGNTVINIQQDVKIPYPVPTGGIDAQVSVTIPQSAAWINITGSISGSPSFEANVSVDGGATENIPIQTASDNAFLFALELQSTTEFTVFSPLETTPPL